MQIQQLLQLSNEKLHEQLEDFGESKPANTGRLKLLKAVGVQYSHSEQDIEAAFNSHEADVKAKADSEARKALDEGSQEEDPVIGYVINVQATKENKSDLFLGSRGRSAQIKRARNVLVKPWMYACLVESKLREYDRDEKTGGILDSFQWVQKIPFSVQAVVRKSQKELFNKLEFTDSELQSIRLKV